MPENNGRNALAELAEEMREGLIHLEYDTVPLWVRVYGKAQRIVAELAKADFIYSTNPVNNDCVKLRLEAFKKCREIAEEGVKDGK